MPDRLNRIEIALSHRTTVLPWSVRDQLVSELSFFDHQDIVDEFHEVGATRPVTLTVGQKAVVLERLDAWAGEVGGDHPIPKELIELRNELREDLYRA